MRQICSILLQQRIEGVHLALFQCYENARGATPCVEYTLPGYGLYICRGEHPLPVLSLAVEVCNPVATAEIVLPPPDFEGLCNPPSQRRKFKTLMHNNCF